jgi:2-polyprenyl-6-methoxyphenol hydroxylase-like FAD-dependent oxidoreductase
MSAESVPVLIVGGGPTGLVLSMLLSRLGVNSRVVERDPSTCDHPRAHVVNTRSMEILRSFGLDGAVLAEALNPMAAGSIRWVTSIAGRELAHLLALP